LLPDYAGSTIGSALALGPLAFVHPAGPVAWVLAAAGALFLVYFVRTVGRQLIHIKLDETAIRVGGPFGVIIRWEELCSLGLDYYSTRRDREGGWMQLRLRDARHTIRLDSDLEGFVDLVRAASAEALRRGLSLDESTRSNLRALGR
jgi:hypothetical protein